MISKTAAIILAAGKGVRMKSDFPKALCEVSGKPMVEFLIDSVTGCKIDNMVVIGGYKIKLLKKRLSSYKLELIEQKRLLGSAHAVKQAEKYFKRFKGIIVVLYADTPLIKPSTIKSMLSRHRATRASATLLTVKTDDPKEYGRIQRDQKKRICGIVEYTDLKTSGEPRAMNSEVNIGAYCFDSGRLFEGLSRIKKNKKKGEFYLTDIISYFYKQGYPISSYATADTDEALGVNRGEDLNLAEEILRKRVIAGLLQKGVVVKDPGNTYIQEGVSISEGTIIYPFVVIERGVVVGKGCKVGPFAHLRSGTVLKSGSTVGNFVELVRSEIGYGSRVKHHTYLGDTLLGKGVNVGAGTITANYDGKKKNRTVIDDKAFIGSGTTIIAPVKIGKQAVTGAGSVIVKEKNVLPRTVVVGVPARPLSIDTKKGHK